MHTTPDRPSEDGAHLVVFLQDLAEAGEVERLVVLQQDEAEVELAECQLDVVHVAQLHLASDRGLRARQPMTDGGERRLRLLRLHLHRAQVGHQRRELPACLRQLLCIYYTKAYIIVYIYNL